MDIDQLTDFCATLPQVKKKGSAAPPAWYLDNRLVVRCADLDTLVIRCDFAERDRLLAAYPDTFGVPPAMEAHQKVQAELAGDSEAIKLAIRSAWRLQGGQ